MSLLGPLLQQILQAFIKDAAPDQLRRRMEKSIPRIVKGMTEKGMTPAKAAVPLVVRDAMFRLWRSVIPSGDIADFVRDRTEDKVVPLVLQRLTAGASLKGVVQTTLDVILEQAF